MTKRNVYINKETSELIEKFMKEENILTYSEAVRMMLKINHDERESEVSRLTNKLKGMDRNISILTNLVVYMAESMDATKHDKRMSKLYFEAKSQVENDIKQNMSQSRLMFNE